MSFWSAVVIIVLIVFFAETYKTRVKARSRYSSDIADKLEARMERLEVRMANIETIILDKEKADKFDRL